MHPALFAFSTSLNKITVEVFLYISETENVQTVYYAPFKKEGHIVLLMSVGRSIYMFVRLSVDQMVSENYLENFLSHGIHISHADWSW